MFRWQDNTLCGHMWTPDNHSHMWIFPKPLPQIWKHRIVWMLLNAVSLRFSFRYFPAWQSPSAQSKLNDDIVCQGWIVNSTFRSTSVPDFTNTLVAEYIQILTAKGNLPQYLSCLSMLKILHVSEWDVWFWIHHSYFSANRVHSISTFDILLCWKGRLSKIDWLSDIGNTVHYVFRAFVFPLILFSPSWLFWKIVVQDTLSYLSWIICDFLFMGGIKPG